MAGILPSIIGYSPSVSAGEIKDIVHPTDFGHYGNPVGVKCFNAYRTLEEYDKTIFGDNLEANGDNLESHRVTLDTALDNFEACTVQNPHFSRYGIVNPSVLEGAELRLEIIPLLQEVERAEQKKERHVRNWEELNSIREELRYIQDLFKE